VQTTDALDRPPLHRRLLATDDPRTFARVLGIVGLLWVLDVVTRRAASGSPEVGSGSSLIWWALRSNPAAWLALTIGTIALLLGPGRSRALAGWDRLEHGDAVRLFAMPLVVLSAWYHAFYSYNFFLDEWHHLDRLVIIGLAIAVWWRPIFLVPLVLVARVIDAQFLVPFVQSPGTNIGELLLMCLLVVAAALVGFALHGDGRISGVVLVMSAVVASHFFEPGRSKVSMGWATNSDLREFARASYTAGWRGAGDGTWSDSLASIVDTLHLPIILGTLVLEAGALIAVANYRLLRWWLVGWILLHGAIFAVSGFWLFEWVVVELLLLILLFRRDLRDSLRENDTPARALLAVGLVAIGAVLFHPPKLAWLDAPVSYGYEIEAVGASGTRYSVPLSEFGSLSENIGFGFVGFRPEPNAVYSYGGVNSTWLLDQLRDVSTFDDLDTLESSFDETPDDVRVSSEQLVVSWLEHTNDDRGSTWFLISPVSRYWTSVDGPEHDGDEQLISVEVIRVRSIHNPEQRFEREQVLTIEWVDGAARVVRSEDTNEE
jgi:hypothetical protein